jgi:polyketide synthase PksJ
MKNSHVLIENIEPFDDIWFKDCYYSALFPIIKHFYGSLNPFLLNEIYSYKYSSDGAPQLYFDSKQLDNNQQLFDKLGICLEQKIICENVLNDIRTSIDDNQPVIVFVDCYYLSFRPDAYNKNHWAHAILIYGYDDNVKTFNIIDHDYIDSAVFRKRTESYNDIINSYNGYLKNISKGNYHAFSKFNKKASDKPFSDINNSYFIIRHINYVLKMKEQIIQSFECINMFIDDLTTTYNNQKLQSIDINLMLNSLNGTIKNKGAQRYSYIKVFEESFSFNSLLDSIIGDYNFVRGVIGKYYFSGKLSQRSFEECIKKMKNIYLLENEFFIVLVKYFESTLSIVENKFILK